MQLTRDAQAGLAITLAKEDFERGINNINNFHEAGSETITAGDRLHPNAIEGEIQTTKELYKQLKFQYLEQETKEKFLRIILDNPPRYVDNTDVADITAQTEALKKNLVAKKATVQAQALALDKLSVLVAAENHAVEASLAELSQIARETAALKAETESLEAEDWNNEDNTLGQINALLGLAGVVSVDQIEQQIREQKRAVEAVQGEAAAARVAVAEATEELRRGQAELRETQKKREEVERMVALERRKGLGEEGASQAVDNERSRAGKWTSGLVGVWEELAERTALPPALASSQEPVSSETATLPGLHPTVPES